MRNFIELFSIFILVYFYTKYRRQKNSAKNESIVQNEKDKNLIRQLTRVELLSFSIGSAIGIIGDIYGNIYPETLIGKFISLPYGSSIFFLFSFIGTSTPILIIANRLNRK